MQSPSSITEEIVRVARIGFVLICGSLASCQQVLDRLEADIIDIKDSTIKVAVSSSVRTNEKSQLQPAAALTETNTPAEKNLPNLAVPASQVLGSKNSQPSNIQSSDASAQAETITNNSATSEKRAEQRPLPKKLLINKLSDIPNRVKPDSSASTTKVKFNLMEKSGNRSRSIQVIDEDGNVLVVPEDVQKNSEPKVYILD